MGLTTRYRISTPRGSAQTVDSLPLIGGRHVESVARNLDACDEKIANDRRESRCLRDDDESLMEACSTTAIYLRPRSERERPSMSRGFSNESTPPPPLYSQR